MPPRAHRALRSAVEAALALEGHHIALEPGDNFPPIEIEFPARPLFDFLWPALRLVVSDRTKRLFEEHGVHGATLCRAVLRRVGKPHPFSRIPTTEFGEQEELIDTVELEPRPESFGPLYEMVIHAQSHRPAGARVSTCPICGREDVTYRQENDKLTLTHEMVPDADVFYLADTLYVIVTDQVKAIVEHNHLSNVEFSQML